MQKSLMARLQIQHLLMINLISKSENNEEGLLLVQNIRALNNSEKQPTMKNNQNIRLYENF